MPATVTVKPLLLSYIPAVFPSYQASPVLGPCMTPDIYCTTYHSAAFTLLSALQSSLPSALPSTLPYQSPNPGTTTQQTALSARKEKTRLQPRTAWRLPQVLHAKALWALQALSVLSCVVVLSLGLSACSSSSFNDGSSETSERVLAHAEDNVLGAISAIRAQAKQSALSSKEALAQAQLSIATNDFTTVKQAVVLSQLQDLRLTAPFTPYTGSKARIYGSTSRGCIAGAWELNDQGQDFQVQRYGNDRNFAHPLLLQYLADLRLRTKKQGFPPLLIGDMSRPFGGPLGANSSHASHNTGIDVDLPFDFAEPRKSAYELSHPNDVYIVKGQEVQPSFTTKIAEYIKLAASDPRVDRIFVAPMIKKQMCSLYEDKPGAGFLRKLRPWFGHQAHMHVRLKCPSDSPDCIPQTPMPEGTGCGAEVESWFLPPSKKNKASKATASTTNSTSTSTSTNNSASTTSVAPASAAKKSKEWPQQCKVLFGRYTINQALATKTNTKPSAVAKAAATKVTAKKAKQASTTAKAKAKATSKTKATSKAKATSKTKASSKAKASSKDSNNAKK